MLAENKRKKELIEMLQQMGYDSDPVKAWKGAQEKVRKRKNTPQHHYLCRQVGFLFILTVLFT